MLLGVFCCLKCNHKKRLSNCKQIKVLLENGWNCKQMITESEAAIPLETTLHAFRNQEKTKQRSTIVIDRLRLWTGYIDIRVTFKFTDQKFHFKSF